MCDDVSLQDILFQQQVEQEGLSHMVAKSKWSSPSSSLNPESWKKGIEDLPNFSQTYLQTLAIYCEEY